MPETLARQVIALIARSKEVDPETIGLDATLEDLNIDSLDGLNLFFELEEALDISIPDDRARSMRSVRQIVEELERLVLDRNAPNAAAQG
jgi:acyl carrier protein